MIHHRNSYNASTDCEEDNHDDLEEIVQVLDHPMINLSKEEIRESMEETLG